jgi:hypothetical protein
MCSMPSYTTELTHVRLICICKGIGQRLLLLFLSFYLCLRHKCADLQVTLSTCYLVSHFVVILHASSLWFLYLYSYTYVVLFRLMMNVLDVMPVDDTTIRKILTAWVYVWVCNSCRQLFFNIAIRALEYMTTCFDPHLGHLRVSILHKIAHGTCCMWKIQCLNH